MDEWENIGRSGLVQIPKILTIQRWNINKGSKDQRSAWYKHTQPWHLDLPSSTRYVDGSLRFLSSMHHINGWCRIVVAVFSPMRVDTRSCMNFFRTKIASIIDDSRRGMSDVAFRTAPPIGRLSCYKRHLLGSPWILSVWSDFKYEL